MRTALLGLTLGACASSGPAKEGQAPTVRTETRNVTVAGPASPAYSAQLTEDKNVMVASILAPIDSVWHTLPGVFAELGVDPTTLDQEKHVIANSSFFARRSLGGVRLSKYFDCGSTVMGPNADQMQLIVSLTVQALPDSLEVTTLHTQVTATGRSQGTSDPSVNCGSSGQLESRIARMVNDDLAHRRRD